MPRDLLAYLNDIHEAGRDALRYVGSMSLEEYQLSDLTQAAVERKFSIIGEAINQAINYYPELQGKINMERDIVNFRHP